MTTNQTVATGPAAALPNVVYVVEQPESSRDHDEAEMGRLLQAIWRRRWWIAGLTTLITLAGVAYAMLATPIYRADAVLLPRARTGGLGLSEQLSQFSGLAGLAGISVNSGEKQEPLGVLRSNGFARRFIVQNKLLDVLADESGVRIVGDGAGGESPGIARIVSEFKRSVMSVEEDQKSGLVTVAVEWTNPDVAAKWANGMVRQLNDEMRLRALREADGNIRYLSDQLAKTGPVAIQESIARVLESEMQKAMLARGTNEYAFRIIDAAVPPAQRERPKRALIVVVAFVLGLGAAVSIALVADPMKRVLAAVREA